MASSLVGAPSASGRGERCACACGSGPLWPLRVGAGPGARTSSGSRPARRLAGHRCVGSAEPVGVGTCLAASHSWRTSLALLRLRRLAARTRASELPSPSPRCRGGGATAAGSRNATLRRRPTASLAVAGSRPDRDDTVAVGVEILEQQLQLRAVMTPACSRSVGFVQRGCCERCPGDQDQCGSGAECEAGDGVPQRMGRCGEHGGFSWGRRAGGAGLSSNTSRAPMRAR